MILAHQPSSTTPNDSPKITPDDPRYLAVVEKRFNKRFSASPDYVRLVSSTDQAAEICRAIATPAVKMIFDIYQCQCETGDITCSLDRAWDQVGCIQIADNPGRTEPGTGEVNFLHLLRHIRDKGWTGRVEMEHGTSRPGAEGARAVLDAYGALSRKLAGTPAKLGGRGPMLDKLEPDHRGSRAT